MFENQKFIYNSISNQNLLYANQLTVFAWNDIVNGLRIQTNETTSYIEMLHKWLFGNTTSVLQYTDGFYVTITKQHEEHVKQYLNLKSNFDSFVSSVYTMFETSVAPLINQVASNSTRISDLTELVSTLAPTTYVNEENSKLDAKISKLDSKINLNNETINNKVDTQKEDFVAFVDSVARIYEEDIYPTKHLAESNSARIKSLESVGDGINHYKGDFLSYERLIEAHPSAVPGDYAFINTTDSANEDKLVLYIWDDDANLWKETTSDKYVLSKIFASFQESLLDGTYVVKKADIALNYLETDPTVPSWAKQANKPTYSYNELTNKPTLFSGNYNDLTNKPTIPSIAGLASEVYVNQKVADLINSAPTTLDTLGEIATALQENKSVVTTLNNAIANKQNKLTAGAGISISEDGVISISYPNGDEEAY